MTHELKTWPCYFQRVLDGEKPFEIRDNTDRGFQKGDTVYLYEYDPDLGLTEKQHYSGREITAEISYVTGFAQKDGYVVFGLKDIEVIE